MVSYLEGRMEAKYLRRKSPREFLSSTGMGMGGGMQYYEKLYGLQHMSYIIRVNKSKKLMRAEHVARIEDIVFQITAGKPTRKVLLG